VTRIQLFTKHQDIAVHMAAEYHLPGADEDDVRQELRIALWEATASWDPSRNVPFGLFARDVMRRRMADALTRVNRLKHQVLTHAERTRRQDGETIDVMDFVTSRSLEPPELLAQLEDLRGLVGAILGLSELERQAIVKFIAGYPGFDKQEENALTRARKKLRPAMSLP
jgi:RNA polymerase sigma factor (sigma-70 family)